jgi:hypothetical protein
VRTGLRSVRYTENALLFVWGGPEPLKVKYPDRELASRLFSRTGSELSLQKKGRVPRKKLTIKQGIIGHQCQRLKMFYLQPILLLFDFLQNLQHVIVNETI